MGTKDDGTAALDESDPALAETLAVAEPAEPVLEAPPGEPVAEAAPETPPAAPPEPIADDDGTAFLLFARDGLDSPIADLTVTVDVPGQAPVTRTTDAQGAIGLVLEGPREGEAKVSVKDLTGQQQHICTLDLAQCREGAVLRSPKVHVPIKFEPHRGEPARPASTKVRAAPAAPAAPAVPAPSKPGAPASPPAPATAVDEPWWAPLLSKARHWLDPVIGDTLLSAGPPGAPPIIARARNVQGNPVIVAVGAECPNKDCLRLGENNAYREAILEAGRRVGIDPRAIAALIDAEAAKVPIVVPVLDDKGQPMLIKSGKKKGKPLMITRGTRWKADSAAGTSRAVGLTQFIPGTWLAMAMKPSHLHEQCRAKGWIYDAELTRTVGNKQEKYLQPQFRLSATSSTFNPAQPQYGACQNVQDCLNLRNDPTCSILTAADYAVENLANAAAKGFNMNGLTDAEKAKLMYLMHHEGAGGGIAFLRNSKLYSEADLIKQAGAVKARQWIDSVIAADRKAVQAGELKEAGDGTIQQTTKAYRGWLADYIHAKINLNNFSRAGGLENPKLSAIATKIGGAEIAYVEAPQGKAQ